MGVLPLHRQEQLGRIGFELFRPTLAFWVVLASKVHLVLCEAQKRDVIEYQIADKLADEKLAVS